MEINNITNTINPTGASNNSSVATDSAKLTEDFENFLLLLTTQLTNQDPTEPLDANEFTTQLVQFASVEQQINQNAKFDELLNLSKQDKLLEASTLAGKKVEVKGNTAIKQDGEEDFNAEFVYALSTNSKATLITISDSLGNVVLSTEGSKNPGKHSFVWDGKDFKGDIVPPGTYAVNIEVQSTVTDELVTTPTNIVATVDEVVTINDPVSQSSSVFLNLGAFTIPLTDVEAIIKP